MLYSSVSYAKVKIFLGSGIGTRDTGDAVAFPINFLGKFGQIWNKI